MDFNLKPTVLWKAFGYVNYYHYYCCFCVWLNWPSLSVVKHMNKQTDFIIIIIIIIIAGYYYSAVPVTSFIRVSRSS
jgi:hypothetical protein